MARRRRPSSDLLGRPASSTIPDGAQTTYSYVYYQDSGNTAHVNKQTSLVDGRWKVTYLDGFGRTIQVDRGTMGRRGTIRCRGC